MPEEDGPACPERMPGEDRHGENRAVAVVEEQTAPLPPSCGRGRGPPLRLLGAARGAERRPSEGPCAARRAHNTARAQRSSAPERRTGDQRAVGIRPLRPGPRADLARANAGRLPGGRLVSGPQSAWRHCGPAECTAPRAHRCARPHGPGRVHGPTGPPPRLGHWQWGLNGQRRQPQLSAGLTRMRRASG
jgi:hypothetical protein